MNTGSRKSSLCLRLGIAGLAAFLTFGHAFADDYRVATDVGELLVRTHDPDIEVAIRERGKLVEIIDRKTTQKLVLRSGRFETGVGDNWRIAAASFTLKRGQRDVVIVEHTSVPVGLVRRHDWLDEVQGIPAHPYHTTFSPDGRSYLAGGDVGQLRLWEVATGKLLREFNGHDGWTSHATFTPDGKQLLSAGYQDRSLRLWDVATGQEIRRLAGHDDVLASAAISPDGRLALSGSADKTLCLWDLATGKEVRRLEGHTDKCGGLFAPNGKHVLSYSADQTVRLWEVETGKLIRAFEGHTAEVSGAFFLPDGRQLVSYSADKTIRLWDAASGKEERQLDLGDDHCAIRCLAITPDGKRFLTNHQDFTVRLRDLATGRELHRYQVPPEATPQGVSVSPDGRYAADGSFRGFVYLFRLPENDR